MSRILAITAVLLAVGCGGGGGSSGTSSALVNPSDYSLPAGVSAVPPSGN